MNSLDAANDHLREGIEQRLEGFAGAKGTQDAAPQVEAVDILPVVY